MLQQPALYLPCCRAAAPVVQVGLSTVAAYSHLTSAGDLKQYLEELGWKERFQYDPKDIKGMLAEPFTKCRAWPSGAAVAEVPPYSRCGPSVWQFAL